MAKKVKLKDIADRLNVSTVTVSKALSGQKGVSDDVREQIKEMAKEMGYQSPTEIKMINAQRSFNIGVVVGERYFSKTQSFYWMLYQELATKAISKDCFTMLEILSSESEKNLSMPKLVDDNKVDGVIIMGSLSPQYVAMLERSVKIPYMFLDFYSESGKSDAVISDSFYGMYKLVEHLASLGHKRIAFVGTLMATKSINDRYFGYCKACMENGIPSDDTLIINDRNPLEGGIFSPEDIVFPKELPTAFACNCDSTAAVIISALALKGISVPGDCSVVGFDNYSSIAENVSVTTYEVDVKEMARKTINTLIKKISGDNYKKGTVIVEGKVIYKDSTKELAK